MAHDAATARAESALMPTGELSPFALYASVKHQCIHREIDYLNALALLFLDWNKASKTVFLRLLALFRSLNITLYLTKAIVSPLGEKDVDKKKTM